MKRKIESYQLRVLRIPIIFHERYCYESMSEELPIAEWNLASDSNWRHYAVCFLASKMLAMMKY
jgi:hypothetical protein